MKCKVAVNALLYIAANSKNGYAISLPIVSNRLGVSRSYLELIFSNLKAAGLVQSHRGPGGGYLLVKNPQAISIKDIVSATGDFRPLAEGPDAQLWDKLDAHMQSLMGQITLNQILPKTIIHPELSLELMSEKTQKNKTTNPSVEKLPNKARIFRGPNSVFNFGTYLLQKQ